MTSKPTLSRSTLRAIKAYGIDACRKAYHMCEFEGYGASSIANSGPVTIRTTRQADAAINAGRELAAN